MFNVDNAENPDEWANKREKTKQFERKIGKMIVSGWRRRIIVAARTKSCCIASTTTTINLLLCLLIVFASAPHNSFLHLYFCFCFSYIFFFYSLPRCLLEWSISNFDRKLMVRRKELVAFKLKYYYYYGFCSRFALLHVQFFDYIIIWVCMRLTVSIFLIFSCEMRIGMCSFLEEKKYKLHWIWHWQAFAF